MTPGLSLSDTEQRICEAVAARAAALRSDLDAWVAIPTGGGHASGLAELKSVISSRLQALGAEIESIQGATKPWWLTYPADRDAEAVPPPDVLVARSGVQGGPRVMLAGHLDTVHDPHGPFQVVEESANGVHATGPGVVDMKGGVAVMIHALEVLADAGIQLNWTVLLNSDEETGSFTSMEVLRSVAGEQDFGIATEPALADGSLAIERMGSGQFMVEVFGRSAHVGRAFADGVSAVTHLGGLLTQIAAIADPAKGRIVSVGPLQGGAVTNAVPDYAACWGNLRYKDDAAGAAILAALDALATADDKMPCVKVHHVLNRPAKPLNEALEAFGLAARRVAEDLGQSLPFASTGGVCDGNIMQAAGLPTLDTLGVRGGNLHRPDEFIELASLVERCQLMAVLLARIATGRVPIPGRSS